MSSLENYNIFHFLGDARHRLKLKMPVVFYVGVLTSDGNIELDLPNLLSDANTGSVVLLRIISSLVASVIRDCCLLR